MRVVPLGGIPLVACEQRRVILVNQLEHPTTRCSLVRKMLSRLDIDDGEWQLLAEE